ncbi:hypothetical protein MTO96_020754 [Rhipicephalus appendiculatus]
MVIYVEACHAGSVFDGLLPDNINVYVTTAANPFENSYSCYYDEYLKTPLGDAYSVHWLEQSDKVGLKPGHFTYPPVPCNGVPTSNVTVEVLRRRLSEAHDPAVERFLRKELERVLMMRHFLEDKVAEIAKALTRQYGGKCDSTAGYQAAPGGL